MQTIHIEATLGTGDCEDCGFYDYGHFAITFEDGTVLSGGHDGHLGGGTWDGQMRTLYQWCLAKLGYIVHMDGIVYPVPTLFRHKIEPEYGTETVTLFEGTPEVLALRTARLPYPDYPEADFVAAVQLPALDADGEPLVLAVAQAPAGLLPGRVIAWQEDDDDAVYRLLLEQRSRLTVVKHVEEDDPDDDPEF
jgi:hypothetical protein